MFIGTVSGIIGRDAEHVEGDKPRTTFPIATTFGFGENQKTVWFNITKWGKASEAFLAALKKGTKVIVSGNMTVFETKEGRQSFGVNVMEMEIVSKGSGSTGYTPREKPSETPPAAKQELIDDEIPF